MNFLFLFLCLMLQSNIINAQDEIEYNNPPRVSNNEYKIDCRDIVSNDKYCKFKLTIENPSKSNYLVYDLEKVGFEYLGIGTYSPRKSKKLVIAPSEKESRVIKVEGDMDYRVGTFNLQLNGLMSGAVHSKPNFSELAVADGTTNKTESEGITISCLKYTQKKTKIMVQLEIAFEGEDNQVVEFDPNSLKVKDKDGNIMAITINNTKKIAFLTGDKEKINLSFESAATQFQISSENVFQVFALTPLSVEKINVVSPNYVKATTVPNNEPVRNSDVVTNSNTTTNTTVVTANTTSCEAYQGPQNASVRVKILADEGICFKLKVDGQPSVPQFTSSAIIYLYPGGQKMEFTLPNGTSISKSIYVPDTYEAIGYRLKEKKNGEYVVNYVATDQVLNAKGEAARAAMMAGTQNNTTSAHSSSSSSNSSSSNNSGSGSGCFGSPSSGASTVKLKITWKGNPVAGHDIQIKLGGSPIGNNKTDGSGNVSIKVSGLSSSKIDVYGCSGSNNWSVTGDWVVLDGSNYFHLKLDEVAAFMAEMMGVSVDQIGAGWGL